MGIKEKHMERAGKVREFIAGNKLFLVIAVLAVIAICCNVFLNNDEHTTEETSASQSEQAEEQQEWRFYPIDLVVLGIGGGFCTVMILRERHKAKEGLN